MMKYPRITSHQIKVLEVNCTDTCCLSYAKKKHRRIPRVFECGNAPHVWSEEGKFKCCGQTRPGKVCWSKFSILLPDHLQQEVVKLVGLIAFLMDQLVVLEEYAFSMIMNSRPCISYIPNLRIALGNLCVTKNGAQVMASSSTAPGSSISRD